MENNTENKAYTLRRLNDEDLFTVVELIGAALPDEARAAFVQKFAGKKTKDTVEQFGAAVAFDIAKFVMKNIRACKDEVYALLSDVSGIPADEIKKMPFGTTPKMLKEIFDNEKNSDFFTELSKLL